MRVPVASSHQSVTGVKCKTITKRSRARVACKKTIAFTSNPQLQQSKSLTHCCLAALQQSTWLKSRES